MSNEKTKISEQEEKERNHLIHDIVVKRYEQELQRTSHLDGKAYNIIGISGVLSALIVAVVGYLPQWQHTWLFTAPISCLIVSAVLGLIAYQVKIYEAIQPREFIDSYKDKTLKTTLTRYTGTIADSTIKNHTIHEKKAKLITYASILLVISIALFFIITIANWLS